MLIWILSWIQTHLVSRVRPGDTERMEHELYFSWDPRQDMKRKINVLQKSLEKTRFAQAQNKGSESLGILA